MGGPVDLHRAARETTPARFRGHHPLARPLSGNGYTGELPPERFNLARYCLAAKPADKTALIVSGNDTFHWSYGELEDLVLRLATGLSRAGVEHRDRVFIRMGNSLDYALVFFAANAIGAVPIPASPMLTAREVAGLLRDSGTSHLAWDGTLDLPDDLGAIRCLGPDDLAAAKTCPPAASYADTVADDPAYLIFTSGTSGRPKGVLHGQRAVWGRRPMYQGWYGISPDDIVLHTGAFNWTYTLGTGLCDPFANGATAIVHTGHRDPDVWGWLIHHHGATILASVPGIYRQILRTDFKPGTSLRHGLTAGEALARPLLDGWREKTGRELYEALGMSEISTYVSSSPSVPVRPGSPGKPQPGRAVRILDNGQIGIHRSDPGLFLRYWCEEPVADEWFATGDQGEFDGDGYLWYRGRGDDMMNAGGFRVSPLEVEAVLQQHPDVADCGVREWRVSDTASIIAAFIVPQPHVTADETAIMTFLRDRLAAYKCPKQVWFVTALPRTANGKLIRKAMEKP
ncbi:MAG: acyl--CoA ligase [Alphaproteobacteria bacterium]|nr:acyl--CoA ligase [Alphaproteobacteria bacterium]